MEAYFEYLREMLVKFFSDLGRFFYKWWVSPWEDVPGNFESYNAIFQQHVGDFHFVGWLFYIIFLIFFIALIGAIGFGLYILIRKYVRFYRTQKEKILNLKTAYMGIKPGDESEEAKVIEEVNSRFPKLISVDQTYKDRNPAIAFKEGLSLEELCNSFRNYCASKETLYYTIDTIRQLFAGIATSKLIILEGISGTGKTSMATAIGKFFLFDSAIISVQPSWKDRSELLGYYNEFTKKFNESEFLKALYTTTYRKDLNVICLDEMNLARIEYYFAEFLSVMEIKETDKWLIDLIPSTEKGDPIHLEGGKLKIPQNVVFFGTANNDDSTFTISDKVYDRAISLFFDDKGRKFDCQEQEPMTVPYAQLVALFEEAKKKYPVKDETLKKIEDMDNYVIEHFRLAFGNRIVKQLKDFVPVYVACGGDEMVAVDYLIANKILRKFDQLNLAYIRGEIDGFIDFLDQTFGQDVMKECKTLLERLKKRI